MLIELHPLYLASRSLGPIWGRGCPSPGHLCLVPSSDLGVEQLPSSQGLVGQAEHEEFKVEMAGSQR